MDFKIRFSSLRTKIAGLYLMVFGCILTVVSVAVLAITEINLREDFDERLLGQSSDMARVIERVTQTPASVGPGEPPAEPRLPKLADFGFPGTFFQMRRPDGTTLEISDYISKYALPFSDRERKSKDFQGTVFRTVPVTVLDRKGKPLRPPAEVRLRVATSYYKLPHLEPFYLQVASPLDDVERSVTKQRQLFYLVVPAGLLASAVASWGAARRSLAPIGDIARQAQLLTAAHLDQRIAVPDDNDEVTEMVIVINGMLDRLERAFIAQERFIANVSHELKTPLSVLLGQAQVLLQKERSLGDYDRFVNGVQEEMRRLAQIVNSLLMLARADAGFPLKSVSRVDCNDLVMEVLDACQNLADQHHTRLVPQLMLVEGDHPDPYVQGDVGLLNSMLTNLVINAIHHSPKEGMVEIAVGTTATHVTLYVRDQGPGLPPQLRDRIFERFVGSEKNENGIKGSGLGLAIAKGVVNLHKGELTARNREPVGCEFVVSLPLESSESVAGAISLGTPDA